jgi:hypothetical protein
MSRRRSGRRSPRAFSLRRPPPSSAWRRRSRRAGTASVAACDRSIRSRPRAGTCRFPSVRRSRCSGPRARECARSLETSVVIQAPSPASCDQRRHKKWEARLPGVGGPVESRYGGPASEDSEVGRQSEVARLRPGEAVRPDHHIWRHATRGTGDGLVDGAEQAASQGSCVGSGMESRADREPDQA